MSEAIGDYDNFRTPDPAHVSDLSIDTGTSFPATPMSPIQHPPNYNRISSPTEAQIAYKGAEPEPSPPLSPSNATLSDKSKDRGLAIQHLDGLHSLSGSPAEVRGGGRRPASGPIDLGSSQSPSRVERIFDGLRSLSWIPAAVRTKSSPDTPQSIDLLLSPSSTRVLSPSSTRDGKDYVVPSAHFEDEEYKQGGSGYLRTKTGLPFPSYEVNSDHERSHGMNSQSLIEPLGGRLDFECRTKKNIKLRRCDWLSMTILVLAVYSTIFSGIWLVVAMRKPRYGRWITNTSRLTPATASVLCAALAKTIELSFVTVYVALLGQILSRRAFAKISKGVTIADMTMRAWVMQPGTLITHWYTIRFAGPTILGVISLLAALMAMVYTTASDSLVAPKLKFGQTETRLLYGKVAASFGNTEYIRSQCQTPINKFTDPIEYENTCVSIEHPGQAYHNFMQYLAEWTTNLDEGNGTDVLMNRPRPSGMMYDNTTVIGSWIHAENMTELSAKFGSRIINNVSMAMPHSGVFAAARDPMNNIVQPQDFNGLGEYQIWASVPSPSVNILCASMTKDELAPMVYEEWPSAQKKPLNVSEWPQKYNIPAPPGWLNKTAVDDVFGFGEKYGRRHPVFPKLPLPYNTILNFSSIYSDSLYLLATAEDNAHMLCSIRASLTPNCSTEYRVTMSGGALTSRCEDPADELSYHKTAPAAPNGVLEWDWIDVAFIWATSVSLGGGITDNNPAISRLLTQLIPTKPHLDPAVPSIAEALAVLAGCTLLLSSNGAPFVHFYTYSVPILLTPQYQAFNASIRTQAYASGGAQRWQGIFYAVLSIVFAINVFCLIWLIIRGGFITDFTEPQNLFSLSLNSPPSQILDGSCGGGPENEQFATRWFIKHDPNRGHFYFQEGEAQPVGRKKKAKQRDYKLTSNPVTNTYNQLSSKRRSIL